jgi:hypothetical protein
MKFIEQLKERMSGKTAEEAIDALANRGAFDDHLARRFLVIEDYEERFGNSDKPCTEVRADLAFEYGVSEETVKLYAGR